MSEAIPPLHQYASMTWCSVKGKAQGFTFTFTDTDTLVSSRRNMNLLLVVKFEISQTSDMKANSVQTHNMLNTSNI